jgi:uncharacterized peroxidase-related enzyme
MSLIPPVDPQTTTGHVRELLDGVKRSLGGTPNLFLVTAQSPAALSAMVGLFGAVAGGRLDARYREAIALAVSELNACDYCLSAHTALGKRAGLGDEDLALAQEGRAHDPRLGAAVRFARLLAERRGRPGEAALSEARQAGLRDDEILEIVANVALTTFTNYVNEVAGTDIDFPVVRHHPR